jgi:hypothetical protein
MPPSRVMIPKFKKKPFFFSNQQCCTNPQSRTNGSSSMANIPNQVIFRVDSLWLKKERET